MHYTDIRAVIESRIAQLKQQGYTDLTSKLIYVSKLNELQDLQIELLQLSIKQTEAQIQANEAIIGSN